MQKKKNLRMIQLRINSLGSKAHDDDKNMYEELA